MAVFNDLPDELVIEIISRVYCPCCPKLNSLSLVSRRLHTITEPFFYRSATFQGRRSSPTVLRRFLRSIVSRPALVTYVRHLKVHWDRILELKSDTRIPGYTKEIESDYASFALAAEKVGAEDSLKKDLKSGCSESQVILLLCILPNLQVLNICSPNPSTKFDRYFANAVSGLSSCPSKPLPLGLRFLQKFSRTWEPGRSGMGLDVLLPAFALPSIKTIDAHMVDGERGDFCLTDHNGTPPNCRYDQLYRHRSSSVKELSFIYSNIPANRLSDILRIPKALTRFRYEGVGWAVGNGFYDAEAFGRALEHTRATLESLDLYLFRVVEDPTIPARTIGSLRHYRALSDVTVGLSHLLGKKPAEVTGWLVDLLPASLKKFVVSHDPHWKVQETVDQLVHMLGQKEVSVPALETIDMIEAIDLPTMERLKFACEIAHVSLIYKVVG